MKIHTLKVESKYFVDIKVGRKTFELRKNDRDYQIGDEVLLNEIDINGDKTCHSIAKTIGYILYGGKLGLHKDYVILQLV